MHPETMRHFGLREYATVTAEHEGRTLELQVEVAERATQREVRLNPDAARQLGAPDLARVAFRLR